MRNLKNYSSAWVRDRLISLIQFYQRAVSFTLYSIRLFPPPPGCRFYPTCSAYAVASLRQYGLWRGIVVSLKRILRCNPLHPGGYDPVFSSVRIPSVSKKCEQRSI